MPSDAQKVKRPPSSVLEVIVVLVALFVVGRFTAAAALVLLALLYICFPLHLSHRILVVAYVLFLVALLTPIDIHVPGVNGSICGSKHTGPRFVRVFYGLPRIQRCLEKYGEFIS